MQIPPTTALLNLVTSLPAQGASAMPAAAKGPQPAASPPPPVATAAEGRQQSSGLLPRGSIINILA
jgi:hypothetical protein